jgi:hypothetical protein
MLAEVVMSDEKPLKGFWLLLPLVGVVFAVILRVVDRAGFDRIAYLMLAICVIVISLLIATRYTRSAPAARVIKTLAFASLVFVVVYIVFAVYLLALK